MSAMHFDCRFRYPSGFSLDFTFDASPNVTALIGPSGAGKTTILNLIAGILIPHAGVIQLRERTLFSSASRLNLSPNNRNIGYVFQDYQLFPHLSVAKNLDYGRVRTDQPTIDTDKVVETLDLAALLNRAPRTLSGGQKQRVALGRALLRGPQLLLLDEPLNAIDVELRKSVASYLKRVINEFSIPTVIVSHDQSNLALLGTEVDEIRVA